MIFSQAALWLFHNAPQASGSRKKMKVLLDVAAAANSQQSGSARPLRVALRANLSWKSFIAYEQDAAKIVRDGLASFAMCAIHGTRDPIRGG